MTHGERTAIEDALEAGRPLREIAAAYGASKTALHRHRQLHLVALLGGVAAEPRGRSGTPGGSGGEMGIGGGGDRGGGMAGESRR